MSETETPILPPYLPSSLPPPEELYAVQVKHVVSPNEVCGLNDRLLVKNTTGSLDLKLEDQLFTLLSS